MFTLHKCTQLYCLLNEYKINGGSDASGGGGGAQGGCHDDKTDHKSKWPRHLAATRIPGCAPMVRTPSWPAETFFFFFLPKFEKINSRRVTE